ncbi:MAG: hypothetical protein RL653_3838 [Pseudomonadota bacterium]|jgi:ATP-dependent RNA helicase DeaD
MTESNDTPAAIAASTRPQEYVADVGFDALGLHPDLLRALSERGYTHPTPVQARAFGPVVAGKDLIVRSKTGTGKTAAFGLPLLQKIEPADKAVRALILCPTRELALQVTAELSDLAKHRGTKVATIYGGASMKQQEDALGAGVHVVVGTPGRVMDFIRRGVLKLDGCSHAVLDEADEMLNQGFYEDVTRILDYLPKDRQVLLFSATVPTDIQRLIQKYTTDAETLLLSGDVFTVEHIHHIVYPVSEELPKPRQLVYALEMHEPRNAIVFCNTRDDTTLVCAVLNRNGFDAEVLNGDLPQKERERVMGRVKAGELAFMVATDIAARGIDISGLEYVVNYSLPEDPAVYLHRVGRTGRIGNKGTAINLLSGREAMTFSTLEKKFGIKFDRRPLPTAEEALTRWTERHVAEIKEGAASVVYEGFFPLAKQLHARPDAQDVTAFLLKYFFTHHRMEKAKLAGQPEQPVQPYPEEPREERPRRGRRGEGERRGGDRERERRPRGERSERGERPPKAAAPAPAASAAPAEGAPAAEGAPSPERRPRRDRERGPRSEPKPVAEGSVRMWVGAGRAEKMTAEGFAAALESLGAPAGKVTHVEVRGNYSYVDVSAPDAGAFEALQGKELGGRPLKIERAKPPPAPRPAAPPPTEG